MKRIVVFLPLGGNLEDQKRRGQFARFRDYYLTAYKEKFPEVVLISYGREQEEIGGVKILDNPKRVHRALWQFLVPFIYREQLAGSVYRVMQLDGIVPAIICKALFGGRIVVTYGFDYKSFSRLQGKYVRAFLYWFYETFLLPLADRIIVPNKEIFSRFRARRSIRDKIVNLPNGVDTGIFSPKKPRAPSREFRLLSVGRLETQKNYLYLINALAKIQCRHECSLTLIGSGSQKEELLSKARDYKIKLKIIPSVPNRKLPEYLNACDLYVQPSLIEGSPKTLIEALSCGCCILTSNVPGSRDIITDGINGQLFNLNDGSIIPVLEKLTADAGLRKKLSSGARKTALASYDLHKILERETSLIVQA